MNHVANTYDTAALRALDAAHHLHPFTDTRGLNAEGVRIITQAKGVWLWDSDGNRILDGMSGLWNVMVGHGRAEIIEAVSRQMYELDYYNTFFKTSHLPAIHLSRLLAELTPPQFNRFFYCSSGSEANDTIIRMVRQYHALRGEPGRSLIISRRNGYHGSTMGGASLGGMKVMHAQGGLPIPGILHIAQPYWYAEGGDMDPEAFGLARAEELRHTIERLGPANVAAFIGEPIQGAGGVIIPPESYWPHIEAICREYGILLIADEVICGFGRTGHWFGCERFGFAPDLMTMAKGLTSGYLPLGGVAVSDKVVEVFDAEGAGEFFHGYTYSAHPTCCAAAMANLQLIRSEGLVERVRDRIGPYLQERWLALGAHPLVGEARMTGLIGALELTPDKARRARFARDEGDVGTVARDISFANGLVMRAVRDSLILAPPLTLTEAEADYLIDSATRTLDMTLAELNRRGWMEARD